MDGQKKTRKAYNFFFIVVYMLLFVVARHIDTASVSGSLLLLSLGIMAISNLETAFACLFFQMFISDSLTLFSLVSYSVLVNALFVGKCVLKVGVVRNKRKIYAMFILLMGQIIAMLTYNAQLKDIISLSLYMLIFIFISEQNEFFSITESIKLIGVLSVACGCLLSILNDTREYSWERFSGIWNDVNFCGFYCIIALIFYVLYIVKKNNPLFIRLLISPLALFIVYTATLTLSRSFVFGIAILGGCALVLLVKDKRIKTIYKIGALFIGAIVMYFIVANSFSVIIDQRGLISTTGEDWTNNRFLYSENALKVFGDSPIAWLTGAGINNVPQFVERFGYIGRATHNTYVDLIVQFGVIQGLFAIWYIVRIVGKLMKIKLTQPEKWMAIILLFYMAVLTITQYEFFYLFIGLFEGSVKKHHEKSINVLSS